MYSKDDLNLPGEEVIIPDATETELALLKKKTRDQLELLRKQTERLELFDAKVDIDLTIKWYEMRSSQLSKLAHFYGQKNWLDRQVLHGEIVAGAVVLGLAVHALAFFAVVGAYYKLSGILAEHYQVEEGSKEAIRQSLKGIGERLQQSIESFNEMERKLDAVFASMEEENSNLSATVALLGVEAGKLHAQVTSLEDMVKQLQEQQKKIVATTGKLSQEGETLNKEIETLSAVILERKVALDLVAGTIISVVKESTSIKTEVVITADAAQKEKLESTEQLSHCSAIKGELTEIELSKEEADEELRLLLEQMKKSDDFIAAMDTSEHDEAISKAQQALAKASSSKASRDELDYHSPSPLR